MALPNLHAPDDEWADERTKRLADDQPIKPPAPGEEISAVKLKSPGKTVDIPVKIDASLQSTNPSSDDDVDKLLDGAQTGDSKALSSDDGETDKLVDEIMKTDGDDALSAQDKAASSIVMKPKLWERLKNDFQDFWDNPKERYIALSVIGVLLIAVFSFSPSRSFILNLVGFRSTVTLKVLDGTTSLPLKGATVMLAGQSGTSDMSGTVTLHHVHLGDQKLVIQKSAFATDSTNVYVSLGSTKLDDMALKAVGTQFTFIITNYVSGKPIVSAELTSGKANAQSDKNGKAVLTVQPSDAGSITVTINADGYRTESKNVFTTSTTVATVPMVSAIKDVFVSKQSGKYDLYSEDVDSNNRKVILAATGNENQNIGLSVSQDGTDAALVSTRDNQHDSDGYLLSTLSLVNVSTTADLTLDHAEQIDLVGWSGTKLIYEETVAGASAANPNRQRIISYDTTNAKRQQLASANYFNGYQLINDVLYYAISNTDPNAIDGLYKVDPDGTNKQTVTAQEVWTFFRTSYGGLSIQTPSGWLSYTIGSNGTKTSIVPSDESSHLYDTNDAGTQSLWVDTRDGKGVLLAYNIAAAKDAIITTQDSLTYPVRWIDNSTIIYRVSGAKETADYVVSTLGGQAKKITDVTDTSGN